MKYLSIAQSSMARLMALLVLCLFMVTACTQDDFVKNAYKTLKSAQVVYDTALKTAAEAKVAGDLSQEQWDQIASAAEIFQKSGKSASTMMKNYHAELEADPDSEGAKAAKLSAKTALDLLKTNYGELLKVAKEFGVPIPDLVWMFV